MKRYGRLICCTIALTLLILSACREQAVPPPPAVIIPEPIPSLKIGLSDSAFALETLAREAYDQDPGQAALQFIVGNDQTLLEDLEIGRLDAVLSYYVPEGGDYYADPVALDGLVFFTHPQIELADIGLQALKPLFTGTVTNWSIFDRADNPIVLFSREAGAGAEAIFKNQVLGGNPITPNALLAVNEQDMVITVSNTAGAIGYGMMGSLASLIALTINGSLASPETITAQRYPLTTPIYFISPEEPTGDLDLFLANLHSEAGQRIIGEKFGRLR